MKFQFTIDKKLLEITDHDSSLRDKYLLCHNGKQGARFVLCARKLLCDWQLFACLLIVRRKLHNKKDILYCLFRY